LQLWTLSKENYNQAVQNYIHGLSLGGQKSLPELFAESGLEFNFQEELIHKLCLEILQEINQ
jgi:oligoendopeptidase F